MSGIAPKGTQENGANTFEIKAALEIDSVSGLRAGYSANATVSLSKSSNVLTVPEGVIEFSGDSTFVYILTDSVPEQTFKRTAVTTGASDGINIEIKEGLDSIARLRGDIIKNN